MQQRLCRTPGMKKSIFTTRLTYWCHTIVLYQMDNHEVPLFAFHCCRTSWWRAWPGLRMQEVQVFWQKAWHVHRYIKDQTLYWPKLGSQVLKHKVIYNQNLESRVLNMLILWPRLGKPSLEVSMTNAWKTKPWTCYFFDWPRLGKPSLEVSMMTKTWKTKSCTC